MKVGHVFSVVSWNVLVKYPYEYTEAKFDNTNLTLIKVSKEVVDHVAYYGNFSNPNLLKDIMEYRNIEKQYNDEGVVITDGEEAIAISFDLGFNIFIFSRVHKRKSFDVPKYITSKLDNLETVIHTEDYDLNYNRSEGFESMLGVGLTYREYSNRESVIKILDSFLNNHKNNRDEVYYYYTDLFPKDDVTEELDTEDMVEEMKTYIRTNWSDKISTFAKEIIKDKGHELPVAYLEEEKI